MPIPKLTIIFFLLLPIAFFLGSYMNSDSNNSSKTALDRLGSTQKHLEVVKKYEEGKVENMASSGNFFSIVAGVGAGTG